MLVPGKRLNPPGVWVKSLVGWVCSCDHRSLKKKSDALREGGVCVDFCPTLLSTAVKKSMTKKRAVWRGKRLFGLSIGTTLHHRGKSRQELKQGRKMERGTEAEAVEGCYFLACSLPQLVLVYHPGPPAIAWPRPQWAGPFHTNHHSKKMSFLTGGIFSIDVPSSQVTLACIKLIKTRQPKSQKKMTAWLPQV